MNRWPLRWKIALYAATFGVVATIAGAATTWTLMRRSEIDAFDRRLALDANELLREFNLPNKRGDFQEIHVPLALRNRYIELRGPNETLLYASPNLLGQSLADKIDKFHTRKIDNRAVRVGTFRDGEFGLRVAADMKEVNQIGRDIIFGMLGAIPTVLIVVAIGGSWVARQALGPVEAIREAAARISPQHLDQRLPVPPAKDEIAGLVTVLNNTFDRLQRSFEQATRFSADASHHLKTPLAVLRASIEEFLVDPNTSPPQQKRANALLDQVRRLTSVSENLLLLARADAGRLELNRERIDLREVLEGAADDARTLGEPRRIKITTQISDSLGIYADRTAVSLIVPKNLIDNAVKYNRDDGEVVLRAHNSPNEIEITIANSGEAIPRERAEHIFERFYRARHDQRVSGQGLGLSIARELALAHHGSLMLVRSHDDWTEFRFILPRGSLG